MLFHCLCLLLWNNNQVNPVLKTLMIKIHTVKKCLSCGVALTGILVLSSLQALGWSKGFSCESGWTTKEATAWTSHTRQATDLRPLYQLLQVCAAAEMPWISFHWIYRLKQIAVVLWFSTLLANTWELMFIIEEQNPSLSHSHSINKEMPDTCLLTSWIL